MITSINEDVKVYHRKGQPRDFEVAYKKLDEFVDKVNDKILGRLQLVQHVYYEDYKDQVNQMTEQLKKLKQNLDAEVLYHKSSEKMYILEEQRDFFRAQVLKLSQEVNSLLDQNKRLKSKVAELSDQVQQYKNASFNLERKVLKLQSERAQLANFKRQTSHPAINTVFNKEEPSRSKNYTQHRTLQPRTEVCINSRGSIRQKPQTIKTIRPRTYSKGESATKASLRRYEQINERQLIIDECIKQTKKEIMLRNNDHRNQMMPFDDLAKITFDKFTRTDKKSVISKLLSNEKMVEQFADFLTSRNAVEATSRMVRTKIGDEKFNEKYLVDLKRSFNKKMFEVKAGQFPNRRRDVQME